MMQLATWVSVVILGPGSVAIFVWFLMDVKRIFGNGALGMPRRSPANEASLHAERDGPTSRG